MELLARANDTEQNLPATVLVSPSGSGTNKHDLELILSAFGKKLSGGAGAPASIIGWRGSPNLSAVSRRHQSLPKGGAAKERPT